MCLIFVCKRCHIHFTFFCNIIVKKGYIKLELMLIYSRKDLIFNKEVSIMSKNHHESSKDNVPEKSGIDLRGTFISVMLLGGFIIISWLGIYLLFLSR